MDHYFASPSLSPPWLQSRKRRHYLESDSDDEEEDQVDHKLHHQQQLQQAPACFGALASPIEQSHHQLHYPYQQQLPHPILTSNGGYQMNPIIDFSGFSYGALFSPVLFPPAPPPLPVISSSSSTTNNSTASTNTMMPPSPPTTVSYVTTSVPSAAPSLQTSMGEVSESPSLSMETRFPSPLSSSSAAVDGSEPIFQAKPSTVSPSSSSSKPTRRRTAKSKRSKTSSSTESNNKERNHTGRRVSPESPDDTEQRIFKCTEPTCGKLFKRSEHVKRHYRSIHSKEKRK